jgi:archaellum biogenesis protein FlaJ (TadC family)
MEMFNDFVKEHSGELLILTLAFIILVTLLLALPQLLRANMRKNELWHEERIKSLEKGLPLPLDDDRSRLAGRIAMLVPMVVMISAATVTSFLVVYKTENLFAVALSIWVVAGLVSLVALSGGVALMGRLAQIQSGEKDDVDEEEPEESPYVN